MYAEREHCGDYRMSLVDIVRNTKQALHKAQWRQ